MIKPPKPSSRKKSKTSYKMLTYPYGWKILGHVITYDIITRHIILDIIDSWWERARMSSTSLRDCHRSHISYLSLSVILCILQKKPAKIVKNRHNLTKLRETISCQLHRQFCVSISILPSPHRYSRVAQAVSPRSNLLQHN